jgi:hypothetical protein
MTAQFQMVETATPTVTPEQISASDPNNEVWFEYTISNVGDEAGAPINYYVTVDEVQSGDVVHSEFTYLEHSIAPGDFSAVSLRIDPSAMSGVAVGDYWVSLRNESGETLAAARLTVAPSAVA